LANIINGTDTGSGGLITTGDSSDELQLQTAETTALTIDSSQNLGIGTSSPGKKLDILSNTSQDGIRISGSSNPRLTIIDTTTPVQFDALCTDTEAVLRTDTNHPLAFSTNGTERMRITSAGAVEIANGNLKFTTNGTGIDFSASASGGASSSILDDYEEGTWTPATSSSGYTISSSTGEYTKIGRAVFLRFRIVLSAVGTPNSSFQISGLPFQGAAQQFSGVGRECAVGGTIYVAHIPSSSSTANLNSYSGVTNGSAKIFVATTEDYVFSINYYV
jgi:hypothetical protein